LDIARLAGPAIALKFNTRFEALYERLAAHPDSCPMRPELGPDIRVGVVFPYLVIYRHVRGEDAVTVIRILHGRRRIGPQIPQGE
jgi:toxin ParE1/3/4